MFNNKRIEQLEKRIQELEKQFENSETLVSDLESEMEEVREKMDDYKRYREEKELMKNSDEPWVDFETRVVDDGRVEVKMDWNHQFIDYLKREGINAPSEEEMVSIYFSSLVREAGKELTEEEAEKYADG